MTHSWFILVAKKWENCPNCVQEGGVIWAMPKRRGVLGRLSFTTFLYYISLLSGYTIREETQWTITKIVGFPKPLSVFDSLPTGEGVQTRPGWPGWVCEMEWAMDSMIRFHRRPAVSVQKFDWPIGLLVKLVWSSLMIMVKIQCRKTLQRLVKLVANAARWVRWWGSKVDHSRLLAKGRMQIIEMEI